MPLACVYAQAQQHTYDAVLFVPIAISNRIVKLQVACLRHATQNAHTRTHALSRHISGRRGKKYDALFSM